MNRRAVVIVALVALATIVITAATNSRTGARLPLPKTVPVSAAAHHSSNGKGSAQANTGDGGITAQTYTIAPPVPLTGCTVSVSNPSPLRGQTAETATVVTTAGAHVRLEAVYPRAHSTHGGLASSVGTIAFPLPISHAQPGYTVRVSATVSLRGTQKSCSTAFTAVL
jgi:hypothetical protein